MTQVLDSPLTRRNVFRYGAGAMGGSGAPPLPPLQSDDGSTTSTTTGASSGDTPTPKRTIDYFGWEGKDLKGMPGDPELPQGEVARG